MKLHRGIQGISIVEVMIGLAILSIVFVFVFHTLTLFFNSQHKTLESTQALYLAEEGQEAVRYIRDEDWSVIAGLPRNSLYSFDISSTTIDLAVGSELIDGKFTRSFFLQNAYRNSDDDLVASTTSGSSVDAGGVIVKVRVEWGDGEIIQLESLLTNIFDI